LKPIFEEDAMRKELTFSSLNNLQLHDTGSIQSTANIKANGSLVFLAKTSKLEMELPVTKSPFSKENVHQLFKEKKYLEKVLSH
jgi:hypothetical protein